MGLTSSRAASGEHHVPDDKIDTIWAALQQTYRTKALELGLEQAGITDYDVVMALRKRLDAEQGLTALVKLGACSSVCDAVGCTPLVQLNKVTKGLGAEVVAKMEFTNPGASIKDRMSLSILLDAEERGVISPGKSTILELTSGNTGISLAMFCAAKGYKCVMVMPEPMSTERRAVMMALGAKLVVTAKEGGVKAACQKTVELSKELGPDCFVSKQFENPANPAVHVRTTGPEIWMQADRRVDVMVAAPGTGGTLTGCARFLKSVNPDLRVVAVEVEESAGLSGGTPGPHPVQGISVGLIPQTCDTTIIDEVVRVPGAAAVAMSKRLSSEEGLLVGLSAGANVWAAVQVASRPENAGKRIVTVLPSQLERYLSTPPWMEHMESARNLPVPTWQDTGFNMDELSHFGTYKELQGLGKANYSFEPIAGDNPATKIPPPSVP